MEDLGGGKELVRKTRAELEGMKKKLNSSWEVFSGGRSWTVVYDDAFLGQAPRQSGEDMGYLKKGKEPWKDKKGGKKF